jgi:hypothetical protein
METWSVKRNTKERESKRMYIVDRERVCVCVCVCVSVLERERGLYL